MAIVKTGRVELEMVRQAANRLAYRTNSKFVLKDETLDLRDEDVAGHKFQDTDHENKTVNFD